MKKLLISIMVAVFFVVALFAVNFYSYCVTPCSSTPIDIIISIPDGASFNRVSELLSDHNIIRKSIRFTLLAKLKNAEHKIKSGEYCMTMPLSPRDVLDKLTRGDVITYSMTIPEGKDIFDIARIMESAGLGSYAGNLEKMKDPAFIRSVGLEQESLEGFLFPDTYRFSRSTVPEKILKRMVDRHKAVVDREIIHQAEKTGLSVREVVTLASLVEKETAQRSEKPLIAAVFLNRLKKGMRLRCDPTVIYGLKLENPGFNSRLRTKHLRKKTPYNTYRIYGLPKGPICNPGLESIQAVLSPAKTDYLYFVSKNNGFHQFSKTLKAHNLAVDKYQKNGG